VEVAQLVFEEMGCTIFAVEVPLEDVKVKNGKKSKILINPADYVIVNKNTYVFALADDQAQADKISKWNLEKKEARAFERTKTSGSDENLVDISLSRLASGSRRNSLISRCWSPPTPRTPTKFRHQHPSLCVTALDLNVTCARISPQRISGRGDSPTF
jgi:hypothetical protein